MSRLTTAKAERFEQNFRECCEEQRFLPLFESRTTNGTIGTKLKDIFTCAYVKANELQTGTDKINKQELYSILFTMGFPLGLIAKTLLNANLAPVRNAVIFYKEPIFQILKQRNVGQGVALSIDRGGWRNANEVRNFVENIVDYCLFAGGTPLVEKMIKAKDIESFLTNYYPNNTLSSWQEYPFTSGNSSTLYFVMLNRATFLQQSVSTARRGQVRRTGLTTSRVAQATTVIPATPNAAQGVTPSAMPQAQNISAPAPARTPVRDIEFTNTIGVEIEIVRPTDISHNVFINGLIKEMKSVGLDVQAVGYTHNTTSYWKITSDASIEDKRGNRGSTNGCEVVSPILKGKRGIAELKKCVGAIRRAGGSVNKSVGVHIHFGANGLELDHWKNIIYNYAGFEPLINNTLYKSRRNNMWAKPVSKIDDLTNKLDNSNDFVSLGQNVFGYTPSATEAGYRSGGRYYTVNLYAFLRHGTIEFRQLQGSVEEDTIIYWVYWLHFLIEVSKRKRLSFFDVKQVRNITPLWLSTYLGNRAFDLSDDNYNAI
jgi:hypothetical protein